MLLPIIIYGTVFAVGLWLLLALAEGRDLYRADEAWGDVIDLPDEARMAKRSPGGEGSANAIRAHTHGSHSHDGGNR